MLSSDDNNALLVLRRRRLSVAAQAQTKTIFTASFLQQQHNTAYSEQRAPVGTGPTAHSQLTAPATAFRYSIPLQHLTTVTKQLHNTVYSESDSRTV